MYTYSNNPETRRALWSGKCVLMTFLPFGLPTDSSHWSLQNPALLQQFLGTCAWGIIGVGLVCNFVIFKSHKCEQALNHCSHLQVTAHWQKEKLQGHPPRIDTHTSLLLVCRKQQGEHKNKTGSVLYSRKQILLASPIFVIIQQRTVNAFTARTSFAHFTHLKK